ncbi:MAG: NfeD family protein [Actinomycetes bacterium]
MVWWLLAAFALGAAEVAVSGLVLGMISGGALAATAAALLHGGLLVETLVFTFVSLGLLVFVRPLAQRYLTRGPGLISGTAGLVGATAVVISDVDPGNGRVKIGGEIWSARSYDESVHLAGSSVQVVSIDGATAVVL